MNYTDTIKRIKFCEDNFIKDGLECFTPAKTFIVTYTWILQNKRFKISFDKTVDINYLFKEYFTSKGSALPHLFIKTDEK